MFSDSTKEDIKNGKHLPLLQTVFIVLGILYFMIAIYYFTLQVTHLKKS